MSSYDELLKLYEQESILRSIRSVLSWDIETEKMPAMGLEHRSKQFQYLSQKSQDFWTSSELENLLNKINIDSLDNQIARRNVELIQRSYDVKTKLPSDLLPKISAQANKTNEYWKRARKRINFSIVQPEMEKLFDLNRTHALKLAEIKNIDDPFDALIDERDQGLNSRNVGELFTDARDFLKPFIKKQREKFDEIDTTCTKITLNRPEMEELAHHIAQIFEYPVRGESARGNIDEVTHPLTISCGPDDIRVTITYSTFMRVIHATAHELGHAIHGLHKNKDWRYQPVNDFGSPSIGELTSRYTENKIGKKYEFYVYLLPVLNEISNRKFEHVTVDHFYDCVREVKPDTSRMEADEASYGLHIIIRFEIEKLLFNDQLTIAELPQTWNDMYDQYLGVEVPNDTLGVMQDLHYFNTYYGYFHGYFMGDIMGSQIHARMVEELPDWSQNLAGGSLSSVINWHADHVYSKGALYPPLELVKHITGENLTADYLKHYLTTKYEN